MLNGVVTLCLVPGVTQLLVRSDALLLVAGDAVGRVVVARGVAQLVTEITWNQKRSNGKKFAQKRDHTEK